MVITAWLQCAGSLNNYTHVHDIGTQCSYSTCFFSIDKLKCGFTTSPGINGGGGGGGVVGDAGSFP
jgi:hypothetical protein